MPRLRRHLLAGPLSENGIGYEHSTNRVSGVDRLMRGWGGRRRRQKARRRNETRQVAP